MVSICQGPFLQCSECGAGAGRKCLKEMLGLMDETVGFSDEWSSVVHNFVNSEGKSHCPIHQAQHFFQTFSTSTSTTFRTV